MKDFLTYLSTAPVVMTAWLTFTAGFIIEINRLNPDALVNQTFPFQQQVLLKDNSTFW